MGSEQATIPVCNFGGPHFQGIPMAESCGHFDRRWDRWSLSRPVIRMRDAGQPKLCRPERYSRLGSSTCKSMAAAASSSMISQLRTQCVPSPRRIAGTGDKLLTHVDNRYPCEGNRCNYCSKITCRSDEFWAFISKVPYQSPTPRDLSR